MLFNDEGKLVSLFENRRSHKFEIYNYDPGRYFHPRSSYKKGDYMTWLPLWYLSKKLDVPLILLTFSDMQDTMCGTAIIKKMTKKDGLTYKDDISPYENVHEDINDLIEWLELEIDTRV